MISACTVPSLASGANTLNDFVVAGKPCLIAEGERYFNPDDAKENSIYPMKFDEVYTDYQNQANKPFFDKVDSYRDIHQDRLEIGIAAARNKMTKKH